MRSSGTFYSSSAYTPSGPPSRYRPTGSLGQKSGTSYGSNLSTTSYASSSLGSTASTYGTRQHDLYNNTSLLGLSSFSSSTAGLYSSFASERPSGVYGINASPYAAQTAANNPTSTQSSFGASSSTSSYGASNQTTVPRGETPPSSSRESKARFVLNRRNSSIDLQPGDAYARARRSDSLTMTTNSSTNEPSPARESWASGYLRRRRESRIEEQTENSTDGRGSIGVFAAKVNPSAESSVTSSTVTRLSQAPPPDIQASQSEFMNRLLAAHKAVDDLLNRRGMKGEDESKFLRMYEWVPVIEEEPPPPPPLPRLAAVMAVARRSVSTESDSGFSMDSDHSDEPIEIAADDFTLQRDDAEDGCAFSVLLDAAVVAEQTELCAKMCKRPSRSPPQEKKKEEEIRSQSPPPPPIDESQQIEEEPTVANLTTQIEEKNEEILVVTKDKINTKSEALKMEKVATVIVKPSMPLPKPRSVAKICQIHKRSELETMRLKPVAKRDYPPAVQQLPPNPGKSLKRVPLVSGPLSPPKKIVKDLKLKPTNGQTKKPAVKKLKQPECPSMVEEKTKPRSRLLRQQTAPTLPIKKERIVGRLKMPDEENDADLATSQRMEKPTKTILDQPSASRTTNARFRNAQNVGSSAEISVQHVSFYETARAFTESKEKCLRIHLRLTSKADRTGAAAIILPTNERKQRVFLEVRIPRSLSTPLNASRRKATKTEAERKRIEERKPPRRKLVETPMPPPFHSPQLRILTDTSVRLMQEKLKQRHQQQAELQSLRGNLKRVPRARRTSSNQNEQRKTAGSANAYSSPTIGGTQKRLIKRRTKKTKSTLPPSATESESKKSESKNERRARRSTDDGGSASTMDDTRPTIASPKSAEAVGVAISKCGSSSSVSSRLSRQSKKRRPPPSSHHERVFRIEEWERRLIDEFRRFRHIPVLESIWRQIFCQRCVLCHLLEPARGPLRAFFIQRQQPGPWSLASLEPSEVLHLFTIWKEKIAEHNLRPTSTRRFTFYDANGNPFGVNLRRVNWKQRRPYIPIAQRKPKRKWIPRWRRAQMKRSGEEEEIDEEEEEEPITEALPPPAAPADDSAAPAEDGEPTEETEGDENEPPAEEEEEEKRSRRTTVAEPERNPEEMTEAERAMLAVKKRQEEESALKAADADSRRKAELAQIEEELVLLKQRQNERKQQRALEEAEYAERQRAEQEKRRKDEEERKAKMEADKARRAEEKFKRQLQMSGFVNIGGVEPGAGSEGKNFVLPGKTERPDEKKEKKSGVMSKEQKEAIKQNYLSTVNRPIDTSNMLPNDLKAKIKQLHAKLVRLESEKYDLEQRQTRQEYDLKELLDREKQKSRNKQIAAGVEPTETDDANPNRPPKVQVASKFDRQVDRRGFREKHDIFQNPTVEQPKSIARGSGKPPEHWGRKQNEEIEALRKNLEPPKYTEIVPAEGEAAKPPVPIIPMQIPEEEFDPSLAAKAPKSKTSINVESAENDQEEPNASAEGTTELEIVEEPVEA